MSMSLMQAIKEDQKDSDESSSSIESSNDRFRMKLVDNIEIAPSSDESYYCYDEEGYKNVDYDRCSL